MSETSSSKPSCKCIGAHTGLWGVVAVLFGGLCWFVAAMVVPCMRVHKELDCFSPQELETKVNNLGGPEKAARFLATYIRTPSSFATRKPQAIELLGRCGQHGVPSLVGLFSDPDPGIRKEAVLSLTLTDAPAERVAFPIMRLISDPDWRVRECAILAVLVFTDNDAASASGSSPWEPAVPAIAAALSDPNESVRWTADLALRELQRKGILKAGHSLEFTKEDVGAQRSVDGSEAEKKTRDEAAGDQKREERGLK
jgi:hypothetical protein